MHKPLAVYFFLALFNFLASIIQGLTGFGDAVILHVLWYTASVISPTIFNSTPLGSEPVRAITLLMYVRIIFSAPLVAYLSFKDGIFSKTMTIAMAIPSTLTAIFGVYLFANLNGEALKLILGLSCLIFALMYCVILISRYAAKQRNVRFLFARVRNYLHCGLSKLRWLGCMKKDNNSSSRHTKSNTRVESIITLPELCQQQQQQQQRQQQQLLHSLEFNKSMCTVNNDNNSNNNNDDNKYNSESCINKKTNTEHRRLYCNIDHEMEYIVQSECELQKEQLHTEKSHKVRDYNEKNDINNNNNNNIITSNTPLKSNIYTTLEYEEVKEQQYITELERQQISDVVQTQRTNAKEQEDIIASFSSSCSSELCENGKENKPSCVNHNNASSSNDTNDNSNNKDNNSNSNSSSSNNVAIDNHPNHVSLDNVNINNNTTNITITNNSNYEPVYNCKDNTTTTTTISNNFISNNRNNESNKLICEQEQRITLHSEAGSPFMLHEARTPVLAEATHPIPPLTPSKLSPTRSMMYTRVRINRNLDSNGKVKTRTKIGASFAAALSGIMGSLTGVGAPPQIIFVLLFDVPQYVIRVNFCIQSLPSAAFRFIVACAKPLFTVEMIPMFVIALLFGYVGIFVGNYLGKLMGPKGYNVFVLSLLLVTSLIMMTTNIALLILSTLSCVLVTVCATWWEWRELHKQTHLDCHNVVIVDDNNDFSKHDNANSTTTTTTGIDIDIDRNNRLTHNTCDGVGLHKPSVLASNMLHKNHLQNNIYNRDYPSSQINIQLYTSKELLLDTESKEKCNRETVNNITHNITKSNKSNATNSTINREYSGYSNTHSIATISNENNSFYSTDIQSYKPRRVRRAELRRPPSLFPSQENSGYSSLNSSMTNAQCGPLVKLQQKETIHMSEEHATVTSAPRTHVTSRSKSKSIDQL